MIQQIVRINLLLLFFVQVDGLDIIVHENDTSYIRFWALYALQSAVLTVLFIFCSGLSFWRRINIISSQESDIDEHYQSEVQTTTTTDA